MCVRTSLSHSSRRALGFPAFATFFRVLVSTKSTMEAARLFKLSSDSWALCFSCSCASRSNKNACTKYLTEPWRRQKMHTQSTEHDLTRCCIYGHPDTCYIMHRTCSFVRCSQLLCKVFQSVGCKHGMPALGCLPTGAKIG